MATFHRSPMPIRRWRKRAQEKARRWRWNWRNADRAAAELRIGLGGPQRCNHLRIVDGMARTVLALADDDDLATEADVPGAMSAGLRPHPHPRKTGSRNWTTCRAHIGRTSG